MDRTATTTTDDAATAPASSPAARRAALALARRREVQAVQLRLAGLTYAAMADRLGMKSARAAQKAYDRGMRRELTEPAKAMRRLEQKRLDGLHRAHWAKAVAGDVRAASIILRVMECRARLLGLDAVTTVHVARSEVEQEIAELVAVLQARANGVGGEESAPGSAPCPRCAPPARANDGRTGAGST